MLNNIETYSLSQYCYIVACFILYNYISYLHIHIYIYINIIICMYVCMFIIHTYIDAYLGYGVEARPSASQSAPNTHHRHTMCLVALGCKAELRNSRAMAWLLVLFAFCRSFLGLEEGPAKDRGPSRPSSPSGIGGRC